VVVLLTTPSDSPKTRTRDMSYDLTRNGLPITAVPPNFTSTLYVPETPSKYSELLSPLLTEILLQQAYHT